MTTLHSTVGTLVARTVEIEPFGALADRVTPDGFAWLAGDVGFVAHGTALVARADQVEAVLSTISVEDAVDQPGTGALACGGLPFAQAPAGQLVVPACVEGYAPDGRAWRTEIGAAASRPHVGPAPALRSASRVTDLRECWDRVGWRAAVARVLAAMAGDEMEKVVLARALDVEADAPFDVRAVVAHLREQQPGCVVFAAPGLVGASPELLVRREGRQVTSRPLAGTSAADDGAALAHSEKDVREHRLVVDAVVAGLAAWTVDAPTALGPRVIPLADVAHLATTVTGSLGKDGPSALGLALALHPTPAVAGTPTAAACRAIAANEPVPRGRYAGPVGWVDARGDGELAVALRCAQLDGRCARLHAGAGIVTGSDADAEWDETAAKLQPMLRALGASS